MAWGDRPNTSRSPASVESQIRHASRDIANGLAQIHSTDDDRHQEGRDMLANGIESVLTLILDALQPVQ